MGLGLSLGLRSGSRWVSDIADIRFCFRFLSFYKEIGAVLYPVLPDLDELEYKAKCLLDGRRRAGGVYKPDANGLVKPFGMDLPFLSLIFAVLASGCQLSDISERERELTSWVYSASSSSGSRAAVKNDQLGLY